MNKADVINSALEHNVGQSTRAEELQHYSRFIVDPIDSNILQRNTNQLILGRRGSGKTLVSGALNERIQNNIQTRKVMSFYYTATLFRNSPEYGSSTPSVKEKTHGLFHAFIEQLAHNVFEFADAIFKKPGLLEYFGLSHSEDAVKRDRLITCVLELLEASSFGTEYAVPSSVMTSGETETTKTDKDAEGARFSVNASADIDTLAAGLSAFLARENISSVSTTSIKKLLYSTNRCFSPKRVRDLLVEIIRLLDLEYLIIFIDEWMSLDECQVEFAERLRRCLFGEPNISVKIAADPYQSIFNNGGQHHNFRGLEVGADIFEAVNLDLPFRDHTRQFELFAEALYKRLAYFEPRMVDCFGEPPLFNAGYFVSSIFSNERAFIELCNGAQGICRDFHLIFQAAAKMHRNDIRQQKIGVNTVRKAILDKTYDTYGRVAQSIDSNILLFKAIRPHVMRSGSRYFVIPKRSTRYSRGIKELLCKRIVHSTPSDRVHFTLRGEYDVYELDYGLFLDLMRAREYSTGIQEADSLDPEEVSGITSTGVSRYVIDLSSFESSFEEDERKILCTHCTREFSSYEPSYKVRQLCPYCFLET